MAEAAPLTMDCGADALGQPAEGAKRRELRATIAAGFQRWFLDLGSRK